MHLPTLRLRISLGLTFCSFLLSDVIVDARKVEVGWARVTNPSTFARSDELVTFSIDQLGLRPGEAGGLQAEVAGKPVPLQVWDEDADGTVDQISILVDLAPAETLEVTINRGGEALQFSSRAQADLSRKEGGEWDGRVYKGGEFRNVTTLTPPPQHTDHSFFIRYEGPGLESDKVGYRFYLDWRNGFDVFGKTTDELVLQNIGLDGFESYHHMSDWGMDILKVGDALGAGGFGYWNGKAVERVSHVDGWTSAITANGPLWAQIRTEYRGWQAAGETMDLTSRLRIGAGSRITWVDLETDGAIAPLTAGLVKHPRAELIQGPTDVPMVQWMYLATYGAQTLHGDDQLGMALVFRKNYFHGFVEDAHNYAVRFRESPRNIQYGLLAAWDREPGGITSRDEFMAYIERTMECLNRPARVTVYPAEKAIPAAQTLTAATARNVIDGMVNSVIARRGDSLAYGSFDAEGQRPSRWGYTTGLLSQAVYEAGVQLDQPDWSRWASRTIGSFVSQDGAIATYSPASYNVDQINSGKMLLRLYEATSEERYRLAADRLHGQLETHPRTSQGAFWHKKIYPSQVWLDGVYMAGPFLAGYLHSYVEHPDWDEVLNEFRVCHERLRDPRTGLYFHGWDESKKQSWADSETGLSQEFWGRGLGWYAMALVDVLSYIPKTDPGYSELRGYLEELADAVVKVQNPRTGLWSQVLDQPGRPGNFEEASGSAMFTYMLAKGVNNGWLCPPHGEAAKRGFQGLVRECVRANAAGELSLHHICEVAGLGFGRDGSYAYYMNEPVVTNDPKGVGPFILAGLEVYKLLP